MTSTIPNNYIFCSVFILFLLLLSTQAIAQNPYDTIRVLRADSVLQSHENDGLQSENDGLQSENNGLQSENKNLRDSLNLTEKEITRLETVGNKSQIEIKTLKRLREKAERQYNELDSTSQVLRAHNQRESKRKNSIITQQKKETQALKAWGLKKCARFDIIVKNEIEHINERSFKCISRRIKQIDLTMCYLYVKSEEMDVSEFDKSLVEKTPRSLEGKFVLKRVNEDNSQTIVISKDMKLNKITIDEKGQKNDIVEFESDQLKIKPTRKLKEGVYYYEFTCTLPDENKDTKKVKLLNSGRVQIKKCPKA